MPDRALSLCWLSSLPGAAVAKGCLVGRSKPEAPEGGSRQQAEEQRRAR